jgi:hypothetical protein
MNTQAPITTANGLSISVYLGGAGVALWALVLALEPDVGFIAPLPWMALFWALQIAAGLVVLQITLFSITRIQAARHMPLWAIVIASGVIGSAFLSPLYWLIGEGLMEGVLGFTARPVSHRDVHAGIGFGLAPVWQEFRDVVGPVTAAWLLISWPRLQRLVPPLLYTPLEKPAEVYFVDSLPRENGASTGKPIWRTSLPSELGDDLIAVASELQYLRVWTTRGNALVLGSLQQVEDTEGPDGIRTHRSWWVNARHVVRTRAQGDGAACELSNGLEVPVSRRRKADVMARFGNTARYHSKPKVLPS